MSALVYICYGTIALLVVLILDIAIAMCVGRAISRGHLRDEDIREINARLGIALTQEDAR